MPNESLREWLAQIGLAQYGEVLEKHAVDLEVLAELSEKDLTDLGIPLGHRKRLLKAIRAPLDGVAAPVQVVGPANEGSARSQDETLAGTGERRQLTVMFCDLVGSTALSEKLDPEELRALLHDYRTRCGVVITRYEGFVARYVGDGILTYFGWPKAHEEDAERALRAALEILQAVKGATFAEPLSVRIGIATGPVVVGEQAGVGDQSKLAIGSTPNLAARLQGLAAADQIFIAASTRRLIGNAFELADLGEQELKGIAEPVHAWRVMAVSAAASRFEAATQGWVTPLVGREQEIGLLLDRWQQAQDGEGQVVLLSGEPGIGKSRILSTLRGRLEAQGAQALRFQCSPYYVNSAFYPSIDNFARALKFSRDETIESKLDKLEALIVSRNGRPLADVRFIASLLSIPCEQRYGPLLMTPQKFKDETLRSLVDLTEAAAVKHPRVMLYEDAHWADPTSVEVLDLLIDRVRAIPLLIVLTHRPEFQSSWSQHGHVTALNLSKLTRAQSGEIVSKLAGGKALPAGLADQILSKTDGVPLYVEELTKSILESGELKDAGDHYEYAGAARSVTIPATLRDSLTARLDRSPAAKEIAQIGAAIGRGFSYELIAAVAPHTKTGLDSALNQLTESGLAFRRGTPPEANYTFKHALVQDAAYDSLLKTKRQELHANIASAIERTRPTSTDTEPELLAHHRTHANQPTEAIPLWKKAGELALNKMALTEAISHLNKGLEVIATVPPSIERDDAELGLQTLLGICWMANRGWPALEVWTHFHRAFELSRSLNRHQVLPPILWGLCMNVLASGRIAESLAWANEALTIAQERDDANLRIVGHMSAMIVHFWLGNLLGAKDHGDHILGMYDEQNAAHLTSLTNHDPKTLVGIYSAQSTWMLGYPDEAARLSDQNNQHARRQKHAFDLAFALQMGAWVFSYREEPEALLSRMTECEDVAQRNSLSFFIDFSIPASVELARFSAGANSEDISRYKKVLAHPMATTIAQPYLRCKMAAAYLDSERFDDAINEIEIALAQIERAGWQERAHYAEVLRVKGCILQRCGRIQEAEPLMLKSLEFARHQQAKSWELRTSTSLARLWQSQGKRKEAYELLTPVYDWFTEGFDTKDLIEAKALIDELAQ